MTHSITLYIRLAPARGVPDRAHVVVGEATPSDASISGTAAPARAGMCRYRLVMDDRKRYSLLDN